jgi:hypothetical protein
VVADPSWGAVSRQGNKLYLSGYSWPGAGNPVHLQVLDPFQITAARVLGSSQAYLKLLWFSPNLGQQIVPASQLYPSAPAPVSRYEAENATISQGAVEANWPGFSGTGFVNYDNLVGSYVQWTVTAVGPRTGTLTFRYANGSTANRPVDITVNGGSSSMSWRSRPRAPGRPGRPSQLRRRWPPVPTPSAPPPRPRAAVPTSTTWR